MLSGIDPDRFGLLIIYLDDYKKRCQMNKKERAYVLITYNSFRPVNCPIESGMTDPATVPLRNLNYKEN